jgi:hypothetical protein
MAKVDLIEVYYGGKLQGGMFMEDNRFEVKKRPL